MAGSPRRVLAFAILSSACGGHPPDAAMGGDGTSTAATGAPTNTDVGPQAQDSAVQDATSGPDDGAETGASDPRTCSGPSRCSVDGDTIRCPHETLVLRTGLTAVTERQVHWQLPTCAPPAAGYPVVIMFQGSLFTSELNWTGVAGGPFGMEHQTRVLAELLDHGFAVITPEAHVGGATFWDTNVPPFSVAWETSADHRLMLALLDAVDGGQFGPLDSTRLFATGISSGGYMTSRMAVSYPGRFTALAVQSASYATCSGPLCAIPDLLPADHPPTLFLHGQVDAIVPVDTMLPYAAQLADQGIDARTVTDPDTGHAWIAAAPDEVLAWFSARL